MAGDDQRMNEEQRSLDVERRHFLGKAAAVGVAGVGAAVGMASCQDKRARGRTPPRKGTAPKAAAERPVGAPSELGAAHHIPPGELDPYYGFWSGGHSGEFRVLAVPSMREIKRIRVFQPDVLSGWGVTNESRKILGTKPDGNLIYTTGDSHHPVASVHRRHLRRQIRLDQRQAEQPPRADPPRHLRVRQDHRAAERAGIARRLPRQARSGRPQPSTTPRGCSSAPSSPFRSQRRRATWTSPRITRSLVTCLDAETMEVRWQCQVDGNMDLLATSYDGKLAAWNQYNSENGVQFTEMMVAERDNVVFVNIARVEQAIKDGKFKTYGNSKVPVADGTKEANADPKTALTCYVPIPKNPHGVNATPDGKYFIASGKLSPTCSVIDLSLILKWFDGELKDPRETVVAEPEVGLGPLHTTLRRQGQRLHHAVPRQPGRQVEHRSRDQGRSKATRTPRSCSIASTATTSPGTSTPAWPRRVKRTADGSWSGSKFSKDRFLPVGPLHDENEQLFDISGEKMALLADHPAHPEPHDFIILKRDKIKTRQVYNRRGFPERGEGLAKDSKVDRKGNKVTVHLACRRPAVQPARVQGQARRRGDADR